MNSTNSLPKEISTILKSRKYNKYPTPNLELLISQVEKKINSFENIGMIGYWGLTDKKKCDNRDKELLDMFDEMNERIKKIYSPGTYIDILISDKHAMMNGYENFQGYKQELLNLFDNYSNINPRLLSEITKDVSISTKHEPSEKLLKSLLKGASKHYNGSPVKGAITYFKTRKAESILIDTFFSSHIYFTHNPPSHYEFQPSLPILYLKSGSRGSHPPWISVQ